MEVRSQPRLVPLQLICVGPPLLFAVATVLAVAFAAVDRLPFAGVSGAVIAASSAVAAWRLSTGQGQVAGPVAATLSWVGFAVGFPAFDAGFFFLPGALLQTLGWQLSTERRKAN